MASQSLYRKWRSQTFDEMVGQEPIIETLKNALKTDKLSHAYLFTGPRGTGKTTTARLLAKTVNCTSPQNGEPCNECEQCRTITSGTSFNVIEIDAASNRGIDSIRELREKVMMPPSTGKYKIYILDEAHMLTTEAFNALLKTLEEPPEYAIFVMATTDVHKMLPTVLSRCQRFDFKRISTRQIVNHLLFVAREEAVELEKSAAELLARTAAGGMRDALSLLDQAIAYAGNVVSLAQVQSMLGVADPRAIARLLGYIAHLDTPALLYLIHELAEAGADLRQINAQIVEYWRALMLAKAGANIAEILDLTEDEVNEVNQLAPSFTLEELTECARICAQNDLIQRNQGTPQLGLELASLECTELHRRAQAGGSVVRETGTPQAVAPAPTRSPATPPGTNTPMPRPTIPAPVHPAYEAESAPSWQNGTFPPPGQNQARAEEADVQMQTRSGGTTLTLQQAINSWESVKKRAKQRSGLLAAYLQHFQIIEVEDSSTGPVIYLQAANQRHFDPVRDRTSDIEWAFTTEFNQSCKVRLSPPGQAPRSPGANASYSLAVATPRPSAYRERIEPAVEPRHFSTPESPQPPAPEVKRAPEPLPVRPIQRSQISESTPEYNLSAQPLARQQRVSENKKVALSKEELGQKVQQDPVVQEFVRTFRANIVDIQPK